MSGHRQHILGQFASAARSHTPDRRPINHQLRARKANIIRHDVAFNAIELHASIPAGTSCSSSFSRSFASSHTALLPSGPRLTAFAPTRPGDVDLAYTAHAVLVEPGLDDVSCFPPALELGQLIEEVLVLDVLQERHYLRVRADHVRDVQQRQPYLRRDVVGDGLRECVGPFFSRNRACSWSLSHQAASIADMNT
jgi:hypothetical protein